MYLKFFRFEKFCSTMFQLIAEEPDHEKPPASGGCPPSAPGTDWFENGDACYLFRAEVATFAEARLECNKL